MLNKLQYRIREFTHATRCPIFALTIEEKMALFFNRVNNRLDMLFEVIIVGIDC